MHYKKGSIKPGGIPIKLTAPSRNPSGSVAYHKSCSDAEYLGSPVVQCHRTFLIVASNWAKYRFHLVLWPRRDGDLNAYKMWLMTAHVRSYYQHYHSSGHTRSLFSSKPRQ